MPHTMFGDSPVDNRSSDLNILTDADDVVEGCVVELDRSVDDGCTEPVSVKHTLLPNTGDDDEKEARDVRCERKRETMSSVDVV